MSSKNKNPLTAAVIIGLAIVVVIAGLITANINYALRVPGGNDFLLHWVGFRNLITEGTSPYSQQTAEAVQAFANGSLAQENDQQPRAVYPLYAIVFYLPFALIKDFVVARAIWMTVLELNLILLAYLSLKLSGWKPNTILLVFYYLFAVLFFHSILPVVTGNASIIVAVLITGGLLAVKNRADELAGVLFAFSTIKPQIALLFVVFVIFWSLRQRRQKIVIWFIFTTLLLVISSMLIIPDWIPQNFMEILRFLQTKQVINFQTALGELLPGFGERVGWAISGVLVLLLIVEWGLSSRNRFQGFLFGGLMTLLVTQWIGLPVETGNFIVLFPAITVIFEAWSRRWQNAGGLYIFICLILLLLIIYLIFFQTIGSGYPPQQNPALYLSLPMFLFGALYWSRWWILQPASDLALEHFGDEDSSFFE
ncbi:MAG: DUF2029 domain-containing protein [Chloroflexi bacterium]|nr:DUF2029 domain-containing protein [Chloroflexota bacterium]